jgi:hypothetical protein
MKFDSAIDIVTFILVLALLMLLVTRSGAVVTFTKFASGVFNRSIGALGGQTIADSSGNALVLGNAVNTTQFWGFTP